MPYDQNYVNDVLNELDSKEIDIFYDSRCNVLAGEHSGYYVIAPRSTKKNKVFERIYFNKEKYFEYLDELLKKKLLPKSSIKLSKDKCKDSYFILDTYPKKKTLIQNTLKDLIDFNYYKEKIKKLIFGINETINITESLNIEFDYFKELDQDDIDHIDRILSSKLDGYKRNEILGINQLRIKLKERNITPFKSLPNKACKKSKSLSEIEIFKLDIAIRKIFNKIQYEVNKLSIWKEEFNNIEYLFSLENLAYTVYSDSRGYSSICFDIAKKLYNIDLKCWKKKRGDEFIYNNYEEEDLHKKYLNISKNGIYINFKEDEKIYYWWLLEISENYPKELKIKKEYEGMLNFSIKDFRSRYSTIFKKEISNLDRLMFPSSEECTLLHLLIMCRENINSDVLRDWKVNKINKRYLLGMAFPDGIRISGKKGRSNNELKEHIIMNNTEHKKILDFYIKWAKPLYELSNNNELFQYAEIKSREDFSANGRIGSLNINLINKRLNLRKNYYLTKEFVEEFEINLENIKLTAFRPYHNYSNYIKGLTYIERQIDLGHKNIETQQRYESSIQDSEVTNLRIKNCIDEVIERIDEDENNIYYKGLISNCKDPKNPIHKNAKIINENERCTDWFNCLGCSQCKIVPKENGPYLKARIDYMEYQRDILSDLIWEKEFKDSYTIANQIWDSFSLLEQKEYLKRSKQFSEVVKIRFKSKLKINKKETI